MAIPIPARALPPELDARINPPPGTPEGARQAHCHPPMQDPASFAYLEAFAAEWRRQLAAVRSGLTFTSAQPDPIHAEITREACRRLEHAQRRDEASEAPHMATPSQVRPRAVLGRPWGSGRQRGGKAAHRAWKRRQRWRADLQRRIDRSDQIHHPDGS